MCGQIILMYKLGCLWLAIETRLKELRRIAQNVIDDDKVIDRDINYHLLHIGLYKSISKDETLIPHIWFG